MKSALERRLASAKDKAKSLKIDFDTKTEEVSWLFINCRNTAAESPELFDFMAEHHIKHLEKI